MELTEQAVCHFVPDCFGLIAYCGVDGVDVAGSAVDRAEPEEFFSGGQDTTALTKFVAILQRRVGWVKYHLYVTFWQQQFVPFLKGVTVCGSSANVTRRKQ
jgi:hypothetical protein